MSKKMMLLALAVASVAMFALPAAASAQEIHLEGVTNFVGTFGALTLGAEGEPTITCESGDVEGTVAAGGTTGTINLDFTGCHTKDPIFGSTIKCHTTGSALDNTIETSGTFHLITVVNKKETKPAILVTPATTTFVCGGIATTVLHGNVIGTITSPACGTESKTMSLAFSATTAPVQEHLEYTGVKYDLTATTGEGGAAKTAGLTTTSTTESTTSGKLNCT